MTAAFCRRFLAALCIATAFVSVSLPARAAPPKRSGAARVFAKPPPLRLVAVRALPSTLRKSVPVGYQSPGGVRQGAYWFVWYRNTFGDPKNEVDQERNPHRWNLAIWKSRTRGKRMFLRRLRVVRLPPGCSVPLPHDIYSNPNETDWLRPRERSGPIWNLSSGEGALSSYSLYVFPRGFEGPLWIDGGGGGIDAGHTWGYDLGPPDARGFRVLECSYREPAGDKYGGGDANDIYTWRRYWTGKGWDKKGPEHFKHVEPNAY